LETISNYTRAALRRRSSSSPFGPWRRLVIIYPYLSTGTNSHLMYELVLGKP
jgi:hypothetical protein